MNSTLSIAIALFVLFGSVGTVNAHESRPILIEITELAEKHGAGKNSSSHFAYQLYWKIPPTVPRNSLPIVTLPIGCSALENRGVSQQGSQYLGKKIYLCKKTLSEQSIGLKYPTVNPSVTSLFRLHFLNGEQHSRLLKPGETKWQVPKAEDFFSVAKGYTVLGIQHIWEGIDHLLFVACLIFIAGKFKRILITITGFTISHSVTLILATLGWVRLPIPPVEAVIALSIVFLAHEIAINDRQSWTFKYPVIVSSSFGLLHGFGFAAVLGDLGLPQTELGSALLFFNLGVEIGQLLFICVLVLIFTTFTKLYLKLLNRRVLTQNAINNLQLPASYVIGIVASYWMTERVLGFWS
ncbi:HupE/UreJ family protein [Vibrio kyushuensis]|uniref:HupE/UreJ family protein n=1 Tax=Vibrio kyushuensis TaxID=2910249 RepID=UPI003D0B7AB6